MQIRIGWMCRECELDQELVIDSSKLGVLVGLPQPTSPWRVATVPDTELVRLECRSCGHTSGELGLGYRFNREVHAPKWEGLPGPR